MGLDMTLYIEKHEYKDIYITDYPTAELGSLAEKFDNTCKCIDTLYEVMYWRKANQIHKFFVDVCAGGTDECQKIWVSREQIKDLYSRCLQVMTDHSLAAKLLPSGSGFFFGSTEYDEWYFEDIRKTADFLKEFIEIIDKPEYKEYYIVYQASW